MMEAARRWPSVLCSVLYKLLVAWAIAAHACPGGRALAVELTPPRTVVTDVQTVDSWCGKHRIIYTKNNILIWKDFIGGSETKLSPKNGMVRVRGCSADGRWLITESDGYFHEGGDPDCEPFSKYDLPRVLLWDAQQNRRYTIGRGHFNLDWSADGETLLYALRPFCGLEYDRRAWFRIPREVHDLQAIDLAKVFTDILPPQSEWRAQKRVGIARWIDAGRFIAQLADGAGHPLMDEIPSGAIVAVTLGSGRAASLRQLNPSQFRSSWKLTVEQLAAPASDEILRRAGCKIDASFNVMSCDKRRDPLIQDEDFRSRLPRMCDAEHKNEQLCKPGTSTVDVWRRGPYALVVRRGVDLERGDTGYVTDIFLLDTDSQER
jgi:hypothetical protein